MCLCCGVLDNHAWGVEFSSQYYKNNNSSFAISYKCCPTQIEASSAVCLFMLQHRLLVLGDFWWFPFAIKSLPFPRYLLVLKTEEPDKSLLCMCVYTAYTYTVCCSSGCAKMCWLGCPHCLSVCARWQMLSLDVQTQTFGSVQLLWLYLSIFHQSNICLYGGKWKVLY